MGDFWQHHVIGIIKTNCFVFGNPKEAIMVDPGGSEAVTLAASLNKKGIEIKHVLVTHGHFDHLGWAAEVQDVVEGAKVYLHEGEKPAYEPFLNQIPRYGLPPVTIREPDVWLTDNQELNLGKYSFRVIHTPGHSPGSATFQVTGVPNEIDLEFIPLKRGHSAFVGDCVFEGSIGRTDLPFSNSDDMVISLKKLMNELNPHTRLYPGHGNDTELEREMKNNPFLLAIQKGIPIF